ncbi:MAG: glycine cleavage system protein GcvH [Candidatus Omnitrophota bacterium]
MVPEDLKYTKQHEWVRIDGEEAVIGITDHAQSKLGDITFIELPDTGKELKQTESIATIESVKAASEIYAPLSGKIIEVNEILRNNPEVVNEAPYGDGWICRIAITGEKQEQDSLISNEKYEKLLQESE